MDDDRRRVARRGRGGAGACDGRRERRQHNHEAPKHCLHGTSCPTRSVGLTVPDPRSGVDGGSRWSTRMTSSIKNTARRSATFHSDANQVRTVIRPRVAMKKALPAPVAALEAVTTWTGVRRYGSGGSVALYVAGPVKPLTNIPLSRPQARRRFASRLSCRRTCHGACRTRSHFPEQSLKSLY